MKSETSGARVMKVGLILFIIFGAFFEIDLLVVWQHDLPDPAHPAGRILVITRSGLDRRQEK